LKANSKRFIEAFEVEQPSEAFDGSFTKHCKKKTLFSFSFVFIE